MEEEGVGQRLGEVKGAIEQLSHELSLNQTPRLVAVSKTKPVSMIRACYDSGHKVFGENYVQELVEKAPQLPSDISWHFIGHLQRNKCKALAKIPNLDMIETVDNERLAKTLDQAFSSRDPKLQVMVQVNTSEEESKGGTQCNDAANLVKIILEDCPNLKFAGLMTIGQFSVDNPEKDFKKLVECRKNVCSELGLNENEVELSMGMSHDYLKAIREGSTNVRVGSSIFGARNYAK
eukprot:CAMPEP_0174258832 /NCGR_PEP_ID=MMETSP0439-20130205/7765_1 /TAXON_ID=0 /ORGANISM="Stereomyxa ramosa, Strain Chinc5" /LENGTH=234 /DNA_ID=CAMNT_0015342495 /DNA_START=97 /DNA_END=801 /DNA_ORIENTATION=-